MGVLPTAAVRSVLLAAALIACVACGDTTAPGTTQTEASASPSEIVTPTATPAAAQTAVKFVNAPLTVVHGHNATLQVKTAPNVSCTIEVDYSSGQSTAAGLTAKTSDSSCKASWTWKVGQNTTRGAWPITVTCGDGSASTHITVT